MPESRFRTIVREPEPSPAMPLVYLTDLAPAEVAVLDAIVSGSWAWVAQIWLVVTGHEPSAIASVISKGLVVPWDTPEDSASELARLRCPPPCGLVLTLTPWGAELKGVEIVEVGPAERPKWAKKQVEVRRRPIQIDKFTCMLRLPREVEQKAVGREYLTDPESGEVIRAVRGQSPSPRSAGSKALLGGLGGEESKIPGVPIIIDRRMRGKKK
jgi:hypothetical protein